MTEGKIETIWQVHSLKMVKTEMETPQITIRTPDDGAKFLYNEIGDLDREHFCVLTLNTKFQVTSFNIAHIGCLSSTIVNPREVFKVAILQSASSIIVAHNHPSGNPTPSSEDIDVTKRLQHAGEIIGVPVLDHLIIGDNHFISLNEKGFMQQR